MKLLTVLRLINGLTLLAALAVWALAAAFEWTGSFVKGAAQTAWNTTLLFASGFQTVRRSPGPPGLSWPTILTGLTWLVLWISVFFPGRQLLLNGCAMAGAILCAWILWSQGSAVWILVLAGWFGYYWAAVWRR